MRITRTTAIPLSYRLPEGKTVKLGVGATTKRDTIIVKVETDAGLVGYGEAHPGRSPRAVTSLINATLNPMIAPGQRLVSSSQTGVAVLVFKEEVLPIQLYIGLLRSLVQAFYKLPIEARWEKPSSQRIELTVAW